MLTLSAIATFLWRFGGLYLLHGFTIKSCRLSGRCKDCSEAALRRIVSTITIGYYLGKIIQHWKSLCASTKYFDWFPCTAQKWTRATVNQSEFLCPNKENLSNPPVRKHSKYSKVFVITVISRCGPQNQNRSRSDLAFHSLKLSKCSALVNI